MIESQEFRGFFLSLFKQDGQVTPVDDLFFHPFGVLYQISKMGIEFGGPSREVDGVDSRRTAQQLQDPVGRFSLHDFFSEGAGLHMTMVTGLIAKLSHIDLEYLQGDPRDLEAIFLQGLRKRLRGSDHRAVGKVLSDWHLNRGPVSKGRSSRN
jgi:hypothetical protein